MNDCQNCRRAFKPANQRQRFCCPSCQAAYWQRSRRTPLGQPIPPAKPPRAPRVEAEPEVDIVEAVPAPTIHETAQKLIVSGYLPPPFSIDPLDGRPVWSFTELAAMFDRRPDELVELLVDAGPAHLPADRGAPSSWRSLIEP